jgi:transposase
MFIDLGKNNGTDYLRVVDGYRYTDENGKSKTRRRVVRNIGPLARFDDGKPDYISRLRQSFKDGRPLIESLSDLVSDNRPADFITVRYNRHSGNDAFSEPKNVGYFLLDALYAGLGIGDVLAKHKSSSRIEYDLNGLVKTLVFGRALNPDSKCATWHSRSGYLFSVASSDNVVETYRALDVLDGQCAKIQRRMNTKVERHIGRSKAICFYDVTNYWFEIDDPDEDRKPPGSEILEEGLRKSGPSKAKNRKPIVQMGLFMDDNGIPVSYKIFPGNHIDQTTLRPAMKETLGKMGYEKAIIVADGGLNSGKNLAHIVGQGNGYIVSKSAKGSPKDVKKWIMDEGGYVWNKSGTFKLKSKIRTRTVKNERGESITLTEKLISYWSKKQYDHAMHENGKFIKYLDAVCSNPDKLKDREPKIKKYLVELNADRETGEVVDSVSILSLDMEKIENDFGLMGYYTLMTSEVDMDEHEVIDKYHGLSRIEDSFRVIKSDLEGRPVHVRTPEHINAHFLICFIALTMIRILQYKILKAEGKTTNCSRGWEMGIPAKRIKEALSGFNADALPGGYYRLTKTTDDLSAIMGAIGVNAELSIPTESDLHKLKYEVNKAIFM